MKAMMLTGIRKMELQDVRAPVLRKPTDVLIRIDVVGVCGSDVHYYLDGRIGQQVVEYPFPVGHECAGTVARVGRRVTRVKPGDRVAVEPAVSCGRCDQCRTGRPHTCRTIRFLGCPRQAAGCLSEFIVMPETCCLPLRRSTTTEHAALAEPLSIGTYALTLAGPLRGRRIAVLGAGPIGLCCLLPARLQGAAAVYMTDRIDHRVAVARRAGADWTGNPDREDVVRAIQKREPLLLDVVFECCGQQDAIDQAVRLLKPGGVLVLVGIPTVDRISFDIAEARRREIVIRNVRRQNGCMERALHSIESGKIGVEFMVTHRFPLAQTQEAFERVANYRDGVIKALILL